MEDAGYMPGDILIVDLNAEPERGDCVCAQLYRWQVGTAETIFRIYEEPYLLAATRHPDLRKPLLVDNDRVVIKGVVTEILRARKRLPTTGD
jgi:SOS-response transcriptional repressor LexA